MSNNPPPPFDPAAGEADYQEWYQMVNSLVTFVTASTHLASALRNSRCCFPETIEFTKIRDSRGKGYEVFNLVDFPWFLGQLHKGLEQRSVQHVVEVPPLVQFPMESATHGEPSSEPRTFTLVDTQNFGDAKETHGEGSRHKSEPTIDEDFGDAKVDEKHGESSIEPTIELEDLKGEEVINVEQEQMSTIYDCCHNELVLECVVDEIVIVQEKDQISAVSKKGQSGAGSKEQGVEVCFHRGVNREQLKSILDEYTKDSGSRAADSSSKKPDVDKETTKITKTSLIKPSKKTLSFQGPKAKKAASTERTDFVTKNIVNCLNLKKKTEQPKTTSHPVLQTSFNVSVKKPTSTNLPRRNQSADFGSTKNDSTEIKSCLKSGCKTTGVIKKLVVKECPGKRTTITTGDLRILPRLPLVKEATLRLTAAETVRRASELLKKAEAHKGIHATMAVKEKVVSGNVTNSRMK